MGPIGWLTGALQVATGKLLRPGSAGRAGGQTGEVWVSVQDGSQPTGTWSGLVEVVACPKASQGCTVAGRVETVTSLLSPVPVAGLRRLQPCWKRRLRAGQGRAGQAGMGTQEDGMEWRRRARRFVCAFQLDGQVGVAPGVSPNAVSRVSEIGER